MQNFTILYRDQHFIAIEKPPNIHVHPTYLSRGEDSCMRILRDQIGQWVYTVHRLDRATSGVLLFALSSEAARKMIGLFQTRDVDKQYLAIVRGYTEEKGLIDHPLREEKHKTPAEASTSYRRLATTELPFPIGSFPTARYSLVEIYPKTGRKNQIRKHFAHISHPIIGDTRIGDGRHNRLFREKLDSHRLLLMAKVLQFTHPFSGEKVRIEAPITSDFQKIIERFVL